MPAEIIGVTEQKGRYNFIVNIRNVEKASFDAYVGGNIGLPPFEFWID